MRSTKSHTGNRRSHHALKGMKNNISSEGNLRHRVNMETGMYRGRQVVDVTKKAIKKAKKAS